MIFRMVVDQPSAHERISAVSKVQSLLRDKGVPEDEIAELLET